MIDLAARAERVRLVVEGKHGRVIDTEGNTMSSCLPTSPSAQRAESAKPTLIETIALV
jgi:hypothetical protein